MVLPIISLHQYKTSERCYSSKCVTRWKTKTLPVVDQKEILNYEFNGIEFEDLDAADKKQFNVKEGIKIKK